MLASLRRLSSLLTSPRRFSLRLSHSSPLSVMPPKTRTRRTITSTSVAKAKAEMDVDEGPSRRPRKRAKVEKEEVYDEAVEDVLDGDTHPTPKKTRKRRVTKVETASSTREQDDTQRLLPSPSPPSPSLLHYFSPLPLLSTRKLGLPISIFIFLILLTVYLLPPVPPALPPIVFVVALEGVDPVVVVIGVGLPVEGAGVEADAEVCDDDVAFVVCVDEDDDEGGGAGGGGVGTLGNGLLPSGLSISPPSFEPARLEVELPALLFLKFLWLMSLVDMDWGFGVVAVVELALAECGGDEGDVNAGGCEEDGGDADADEDDDVDEVDEAARLFTPHVASSIISRIPEHPPSTPQTPAPTAPLPERPHSFSGGLSSVDLRRLQHAGDDEFADRQQWAQEQPSYPSLSNHVHRPQPQYDTRNGSDRDEHQIDYIQSRQFPQVPVPHPSFVTTPPANMPYRQNPRGFPQQGVPPAAPSPLPYPAHASHLSLGSAPQHLYDMMVPQPIHDSHPAVTRVQQQHNVFRPTHHHSASDPSNIRDATALALLSGTIPPFNPAMFQPGMGPMMYPNQFYNPELAAAMAARIQAQYSAWHPWLY
ncbi:hypothetical protein NMY22_g16473 [Coprinellus aureogranulatus]|nr:hypothetical protein NMY22_g16473 [Coprinellus aureogranulatus]